MIEQGYLKSLLKYSPKTGIFTWLVSAGTQKAGNIAGTCTHGYTIIKINWKKYKAHRLAWLYMKGRFPKCLMDHINGITTDNKFINLREADFEQNVFNAKVYKNNRLGVKGVRKTKAGSYEARARLNTKQHCLGTYDTKEEAGIAYKKFAKKHHGEFYYDSTR